MRRIALVAGALVLAAPALSAQIPQQLTVARRATVYLLPSSTARRIGAVRSGARVLVLQQIADFDRILLPDSSVGWVEASSLRSRDAEFVVSQSGAPMMSRFAAPVPATFAPAPAITPASPPPATPDSADTVIAVPTISVKIVVPSPDSALVALPHPAPKEKNDPACADIGRSNAAGAPVDTATDLLKNRVDAGEYHDVAFADVLRLPWRGLARRRFQWTDDQKATVARREGAAVSLEGYIVSARTEGAEQTNCELRDAEWHDWHVWLVRTEAEASARDRSRAVVIEITPRVRRLDGDRFDLRRIRQWAREGRRVRVSGWLLLDPDHPDEVGKTRGTIWEIHPVMKLEPAP